MIILKSEIIGKEDGDNSIMETFEYSSIIREEYVDLFLYMLSIDYCRKHDLIYDQLEGDEYTDMMKLIYSSCFVEIANLETNNTIKVSFDEFVDFDNLQLDNELFESDVPNEKYQEFISSIKGIITPLAKIQISTTTTLEF